MTRVIIIGGVAGGATAAARLRRLKEDFEIVVLERGQYVSFANCGLPYYVGHVIKDQSQLELVTPKDFLQRFNIEIRVNHEAISIDRENKTISINLEYIQSSPDGKKGYFFYVEVDGHKEDESVKTVIDEVRSYLDPNAEHPSTVQILGSYPNTHWKE